MLQTATSLRQLLRQQRNNISSSDRAKFDYSINQSIIKTALLMRSPKIASYLANDGEPALNLFIKTCSAGLSNHYLPVLSKQQLIFSPYSWGDELKNNCFNILEPSTKHVLPARLLSTILIPLVGFDHQGHRVGMGGGYYDRTLSFMLNPLCQKKPLLIGIAYSVQKIEEIKPQPWDVPLDAVITERGLSCFSIKAKHYLRTPS
jgi:5-formyltetrahydrofolate cyclo-ligase